MFRLYKQGIFRVRPNIDNLYVGVVNQKTENKIKIEISANEVANSIIMPIPKQCGNNAFCQDDQCFWNELKLNQFLDLLLFVFNQ